MVRSLLAVLYAGCPVWELSMGKFVLIYALHACRGWRLGIVAVVLARTKSLLLGKMISRLVDGGHAVRMGYVRHGKSMHYVENGDGS